MTATELSSAFAIRWLRWWWLVSAAVLVSATGPLWSPGTALVRVSPLPNGFVAPGALDWIAYAALAIGGGRLVRRGATATAWAWLFSGWLLLLAVDQLRWQAWAWHLTLVGAALAALAPAEALRWLRWLTISVYAYSALSKLDVAFVETLGREIITTLASSVGIEIDRLAPHVVTCLALALPVGELVLAGLLAWPRSRRGGVVAALMLHAVNLAVLGPWGWGHSWGVLLWNGLFAAHVVIVMRPVAVGPSSESQGGSLSRRAAMGRVVLALALVAPLANRAGWWDNWPSWALYAPGGERGTIVVHTSVADRLPTGMVDDRTRDETWRPVELDRWLLKHQLAPRYPQNRVLVALARGLDDRFSLTGRVRVQLEGPAGRVSGVREVNVLATPEELDAATRSWLGAAARWW